MIFNFGHLLPLLICSAPSLSPLHVPWGMGGGRGGLGGGGGGKGVVPEIWADPAVCGGERSALPRLIQFHRERGEVVIQFGVLLSTLSLTSKVSQEISIVSSKYNCFICFSLMKVFGPILKKCQPTHCCRRGL